MIESSGPGLSSGSGNSRGMAVLLFEVRRKKSPSSCLHSFPSSRIRHPGALTRGSCRIYGLSRYPSVEYNSAALPQASAQQLSLVVGRVFRDGVLGKKCIFVFADDVLHSYGPSCAPRHLLVTCWYHAGTAPWDPAQLQPGLCSAT